jgi:hypothetical protein
MTHESLLNDLWQSALARLGGNAAVESSARKKGAFARAGGVASAADLLGLILAYCLGGMELRSTSAWAASVGLADLSDVALLKRLRKCGPWMEHLAGLLLGGTGTQQGDRHPKIRTGVLIGAGAHLIGGIEVGAYSKIAAGSFVSESVPSRCTAVGVPARIVEGAGSKNPAKSTDQKLSEGTYESFT